jgi:hypothetical protein
MVGIVVKWRQGPVWVKAGQILGCGPGMMTRVRRTPLQKTQ